jgi:hypothetical protein
VGSLRDVTRLSEHGNKHAQRPCATVLDTRRLADGMEFDLAVPRELGCSRLHVRLTVPEVPDAGRYAKFAEHVVPAGEGGGGSVVALAKGTILVSGDLGASWDVIRPPEAEGMRLRNCLTLADGTRLVQARGLVDPTAADPHEPHYGAILRMDRDWRVLDRIETTTAQWHGSNSIDQSGSTVIFGEYHMNSARYYPDFDARRAELERLLSPNALLRSPDGGRTWTRMLELSPFEARHFHTVVADPYEPGVWYASTGDRPHECRVLRSRDDGLTWSDITNPAPAIPLQTGQSSPARSCFRFTSLAVSADRLLWGTDDIMASRQNCSPDVPPALRGGSRVYSSRKSLDRLVPIDHGVVGNSIRSLVDMGGFHVGITEGRIPEITMNPQVFAVSKGESPRAIPLFEVPNLSGQDTRLTCSLASRRAEDGTFFSCRGPTDVVDGYPLMLKWEVRPGEDPPSGVSLNDRNGTTSYAD